MFGLSKNALFTRKTLLSLFSKKVAGAYLLSNSSYRHGGTEGTGKCVQGGKFFGTSASSLINKKEGEEEKAKAGAGFNSYFKNQVM